MKTSELREEIEIELEAMESIVKELISLRQDLDKREPSVREKTAAAAFLSQFYNGIENILKRISGYHNIPLPEGETWHVQLFQRFSSPSYSDLPTLFDNNLATDLAPYRRFRHVAFHSYGFQLDWSRMKDGVENIQKVYDRIKNIISQYLQILEHNAKK